MLLADLKVFVAIVEAGSFAAAARGLRLPKSSVARQLARLEEQIERRLIARTTRTLELTDEGRAFLPHARRLLDDETDARSVFHGDAAGASGALTVSAPATFGRVFLAPRLPEFRRRHPRVQLALRFGAAKAPVGVGHADAAIRLGALVEPGLASRPLGVVTYEVVATPAYLDPRPRIVEPLDLAGLDLIELRPPAAEHRLTLQCDGKEQSLCCAPGLMMDDPDGVKAVVLAGGGVAALPSFLVGAEVARGELVRVLPGWAPPPAPVHLVYAANAAPPMRLRAFLDFAQGVCAGASALHPQRTGTQAVL